MDTEKFDAIAEEVKQPEIAITAENILGHPDFVKYVDHEVQRYLGPKPMAPAGQKWKRTPYDALKEAGMLTPLSVIAEFDKICLKTSTLTSLQRSAIDALILNASASLLTDIKKAAREAEIKKHEELQRKAKANEDRKMRLEKARKAKALKAEKQLTK